MQITATSPHASRARFPRLAGRVVGVAIGLAIGLPMGLGSAPALAAQADRNQPVKVQADKKVTKYQEGTSVYTGDVVIDQGSLHATGQRATLYLEDGELVRAVLEGRPATFRERDEEGNWVEGEALQADYRTAEGTVVLTDEAWLKRSGDEIRSDRITYDLATEVVEAGEEGGKSRVEMTLQPRNKEGGNGGD
ncbi:lipopolysaccharide transport periplasmic protein LptA [Guyparkeria hydrothermalis]|uniref:lipopolysaccharide transport periplasmic protein LptA n=1 Tax=Guyparkeria hydrothermalis TaxID=923 RepID=UPI002021EA57|nr:lipopolysaccharide transport periplasmic protein LptA [Guyparkeria hydrothermalis]MCL7750039.1 lipopolysaccharide transport periplasmic protein LptA [Guyparkeria hydrothermalis]